MKGHLQLLEEVKVAVERRGITAGELHGDVAFRCQETRFLHGETQHFVEAERLHGDDGKTGIGLGKEAESVHHRGEPADLGPVGMTAVMAARPAVRSRLRATCPCSRARSRFCGKAAKVF